MSEKKSAAVRRGIIVFIALMVLTIVEYFVSVGLDSNLVLLFLIALVKAALIVTYFMHISRLWREESH